METTLISFVSLKGGVGKSTHVAALTAGLLDRGHSVLILDSDEQATASDWGRDLVDANPKLKVESINLEGMDISGANDLILSYCENTDYVLLDTPGKASIASTAAMASSDLILLPFKLTEPDTAGLRTTLELYQEAQKQLGTTDEGTDNMFGIYMSDMAFLSHKRKSDLAELSEEIAIRKGLPTTPVIPEWMSARKTPSDLQLDKGQLNPKQVQRSAEIIADFTKEIVEVFEDA